MYTISPKAEAIFNERSFFLFKHAGFYCAVSRMQMKGNLNGYCAVPEGHPLFGKNYSDEVEVASIDEISFNGNYIGLLCVDTEKAKQNIIGLDLAINVHGGLTYARNHLYNIEDNLLGNLWWFGFDTAHSGDLGPYQHEIDRKYHISNEVYRDFEYVLAETKSLAEQLAKF